MPFPFDMSQVFWGLMNKTMWDCRFGNMNNGFSGFNGGFMNSCWGGNFQMPAWGDSYSFSSTGGSSSTTVEEEVDRDIAKEKFDALKKVMTDWAAELTDSREDRIIKKNIERISSYSEANYEKLTELYEEHKDKIQKKLKPESEITVTTQSKAAAKEFANATIDFKKILATEGESATTKAELATDVDAMGFLNSLQTTKKKSFKQVYTDALKGADTTKTQELKKVLEAVYSSLSKEALEVKKESGISEETLASLGQLLEISAGSATADNVEQLYYWIRMAKSEIADSKYACLKEDFPDDPLLGKTNGVEATNKALENEGMKPDDIRKQTIVTNYKGMKNDTVRMQSLVDENFQTALNDAQLKDLKEVSGVADFLQSNNIKKVYMDPSPQIFGQMFIRVIDKDGNLKCLTGVAAEKDANGKITFKAIKQPLVGGAQEDGKIAFGSSITPEQIEEQAKMVSQINDAIKDGTLTEVSQRWSNGRRMFEEKEITGDRNYKRIFFIESDGKLKEWQGVWYNQDKGFRQIQGSKTPYVDANLGDIKTAASQGRSAKGMKYEELVATVSKWNSVEKTEAGLRIYGDKYSGSAHVTQADFKRAYTTDAVVALHVKSDTSGNDLGDAGIIDSLKTELTKLSQHIVNAFSTSSAKLDPGKLKEAAETVVNKYAALENVSVKIDDDSDDNDNIASYTTDKIRNNKTDNTYRHKIVNMRDTTGINSNAYMVSFKDLVDDILEEYKRIA